VPRERQSPVRPEIVAGTLAYMAPEQTSRINRSIDPRSYLYSFGVTLYQMLTGGQGFSAADSQEWILEKPHGREREVDALLTAFDRVVAQSTPELVLVSGLFRRRQILSGKRAAQSKRLRS